MKFVCLLTVLIAFTAVANAKSSNHSVSFGNRRYGDYLLFKGIFYKEKKFLRKVSEVFEWPPKGVVNQRPITAINITDQAKDGKGGYASLESGGVGSYRVQLKFKSDRNSGYNFGVDIYG